MHDGSLLQRLQSDRLLFRCSQAGVRIAEADRHHIDVVVSHLTLGPVAEIEAWVPQGLADLYRSTDRVALFCPDGTTLDDLGANYGVLIYSQSDVAPVTSDLRHHLTRELSEIAGELDEIVGGSDAVSADAAAQRISSLIVIGSFVSGDPIVLDPSHVGPTVTIFDHSLALACLLGNEHAPSWTTFDAFLDALLTGPLELLSDSWRYERSDGLQFFVDSVERI